MSGRITLRVKMKLQSDAIFGSGSSIPGGEDVAVCRDEARYPYLKGSTLKGLLRESLTNFLVWTGQPQDLATELLGESGWSGTADGRRVQFTALTLEEFPTDPEDCFGLRTFTGLEDGVAKQDTLRTAACVRAGLTFIGELTCSAEDEKLLKSALQGIKWAGAMRSRGFGRVQFSAEKKADEGSSRTMENAFCIRYRLRADEPLFFTDLGRSQGNSYETRNCIPGSAVRGMVISELASRNPAWFKEHKMALLSEGTRFLDGFPVRGEYVALPTIKGFYESKEETGEIETVLTDGSFTPGFKRAKLGAFCALEGDTVRYWGAGTGGVTRIQRNVSDGEDTRPFQTRYLSVGQVFEGYILLDDPALSEPVTRILGDTLWLGADRYAGFGKCTVTLCQGEQEPLWRAAYGYQKQADINKDLYLLALSPLTMLDACGEPCGLDESALAEKLGVEKVTIVQCGTSLSERGGYNRAWECRAPGVWMYDPGSIFHLQCSDVPKLENLWDVEASGLGIRRAEGCGQVLFLRRELFESLTRKEAAEQNSTAFADSHAAQVRRAKYQWVMKNSEKVSSCKLSRSQVGSIQALCEKSIMESKGLKELKNHLEHNLTERGAAHGARFREIDQLIKNVTATPLSETIGVSCEDSQKERLRLLCLLFDYSRKGGGKEGV